MKITPTMRELMFRYALAAEHTSPSVRLSTRGIAAAVAKLRNAGLLAPDPRLKALRLTDAGREALRAVCPHTAAIDASGICIACKQRV